MAQSVVTVYTRNTIESEESPGPWKPGKQVTFSDDLLNSAQLNPGPDFTPVGEDIGNHSGFATLVRLGDPGLFMYEATHSLHPAQSTPNQPLAGQVMTRGVLSFHPWAEGESRTVAITGGTDAYANARGQVIWTRGAVDPKSGSRETTIDRHELRIEL
jgi:hypothetical protein